VTDRTGDGEEPITSQDCWSSHGRRRPQLRPGLLITPGQRRGNRGGDHESTIANICSCPQEGSRFCDISRVLGCS
jgi:hypothetical protein